MTTLFSIRWQAARELARDSETAPTLPPGLGRSDSAVQVSSPNISDKSSPGQAARADSASMEALDLLRPPSSASPKVFLPGTALCPSAVGRESHPANKRRY